MSNGHEGGPGKPVGEGGSGFSCLLELRTVEALADGHAKTPFLAYGDVVRIEMKDRTGHSIFGAIAQTVTAYQAP